MFSYSHYFFWKSLFYVFGLINGTYGLDADPLSSSQAPKYASVSKMEHFQNKNKKILKRCDKRILK